MPPFSSWLIFTLRLPLWSAPLLLLGLLILGVWLYRRAVRAKTRSRFAETGARDPDCAAEGQAYLQAREAYLQFLYNLSHEISNPVQSILTNLDNLASCKPEEEGRWRQYHAVTAAEVRRLAALTDQLRLLAQLETPDVPVKREPVNVKGVIEAVLMALVEHAEGRGISLTYVGPPRPARVMGDRDHLHQALLNLVDNAIKYSDSGGQVVIGLQEMDNKLLIRVSDCGVGIPAEDLEHIFDTAYRARDARSFRRKGSGLGLAIVKRIVEQHGGQIHVESKPGEGAVFTFDLPVYQPF
ncbi:MAG TPA: HAMP domain-containing sensor histidine kinase [Anaerolineales bacterium]|nr:HAMP domain-containing sensor histidine kinase [Anaerolineales bacterium]